MNENTVIVFKNGNYIKTLPSSEYVRGRRAKLLPVCDFDDWLMPKEIEAVMQPFCVEKDNEEDVSTTKQQSHHLSSIYD